MPSKATSLESPDPLQPLSGHILKARLHLHDACVVNQGGEATQFSVYRLKEAQDVGPEGNVGLHGNHGGLTPKFSG